MNYIPRPFDTHTIPWGTPPFGGAPCPSCGKCPTCGRPAEPNARRPIHPWKEWPWGDSDGPWHLPEDHPKPDIRWELQISDGVRTGDKFVQQVRMQEVRP